MSNFARRFRERFPNRRGYWGVEQLDNAVHATLSELGLSASFHVKEQMAPEELTDLVYCASHDKQNKVVVIPARTGSVLFQELLAYWPEHVLFLAGRLRLPGFASSTPYDWLMFLIPSEMYFTVPPGHPTYDPVPELLDGLYSDSVDLFTLNEGRTPITLTVREDGRIQFWNLELAQTIATGAPFVFTIKSEAAAVKDIVRESKPK